MVQYIHINKYNTSNGLTEKNHLNISIDAQKDFDKIQNTFMIRVLDIVRVDESHLSIIKAKYDYP